MNRKDLIRLLLLGAILIVFGQVVMHDFVDWDDGQHLYQNINIVHPTLKGLGHFWNPWSPDNPQLYCPMVFTVWWTLAHLSNVQSPDLFESTLNPFIYHAASLLVHWLCACVVLEILLRLKIRTWPAACGAMIFALHPLQTESVAWASAMKDLLAGLFALLAISKYIAAVDSRGQARTLNYWASVIFYFAALLSKPSTVMVPVIAGVIDLMIYRRSWKVILAWTGWWYLPAAAITVITTKIQGIAIWVGGPLWARPLIALDSLAFYLAKLVLPIDLRFDYGRSPAAVMTDPSLHHPLYWTWIFPVALALILWRSRNRMLILSGAIFVLAVLPELGLKTFAFQYYTTVADRYVYLSMLGVALAAGWVVQTHGNRGVIAGAAIAVCVLGSLSFAQAREWTDTETLYSYAMDHTRPLHLTALGLYQDKLATPWLRRALHAREMGDYAGQREFADKAVACYEKAVAYFREANQLDPTNGETYDQLSRDLVRLGRIDEAIETVKRWIEIDPHEEFGIRETPGQLQYNLGMLYLQAHEFPEAVEALKRSLAEQDDPNTRKDLEFAEQLATQAAHPATRPATKP